MGNHPERSKPKARCKSPTPKQIKDLREESGLTQTEAAEMICSAPRSWQQWEAGDRRMLPGLWDYFCLLIDMRVQGSKR